MIEKLESAGLGFFVKCTETQERLGIISNNEWRRLTVAV